MLHSSVKRRSIYISCYTRIKLLNAIFNISLINRLIYILSPQFQQKYQCQYIFLDWSVSLLNKKGNPSNTQFNLFSNIGFLLFAFLFLLGKLVLTITCIKTGMTRITGGQFGNPGNSPQSSMQLKIMPTTFSPGKINNMNIGCSRRTCTKLKFTKINNLHYKVSIIS